MACVPKAKKNSMNLSARIPRDWTPSPWSECADEVRKQAQAGIIDLIDLTVSSPLACGITWSGDSLCEAFSRRKPWMHWKPDARGSLLAREAICRYEYARHGFAGTPDELLLTAGTSEAYSLLFRVLCEPGDKVLVPRPGYPLLDVLAELDHLECVGYSLTPNSEGWTVDWESLQNKAPQARILLVVNPNNPTGSVLSRADWLQMGELCAQHHLTLVVDEVFADYAFTSCSEPPWRELAERVAVFRLNGLSKTVGLPQIKLAWIWCHAPEDMRVPLAQAMEYVADAFLNVSAVAETLAEPLLTEHVAFQARVMERLKINLATAQELFSHCPVQLSHPQGGWYLSLHIPDIDDENFSLELARKAHVLVQPGYFFDFAEDGWLVCSLLTEPDRFREAITRWSTALKN